jgi:hypothetical protein
MTTILIKKKDTAGAPAAGDLTNAAGGAEIAVNTATKRIYTKDSGGNIVEVGTNPTATTMNGNLTFVPDATYDIGATGATRPRDIFMSRNLTVGGTMTVAGGINFNGNVTVGDSSADTLTINSTITSNLIFTDNTYDIGASGATRPRTGYFGTSLITPLIDATNVEATNIKALDGTAAMSIANSTGVVSLTANPVLSGGTANGVLYLNGSKSATSGSALTFDGTNLITPAAQLTFASNVSSLDAYNYDLKIMSVRAGGIGGKISLFTGTTTTVERYSIDKDGIAVWTIGSEQMRLNTTGLGIGTNSPQAKLELFSNADANFGLKIYHTSVSLANQRYPQIELAHTPIAQGYQNKVFLRYQNSVTYGNYPSLAVITDAAGGGEVTRMFLDGFNGYLGINTTQPSEMLQINSGNIRLQGSSPGQILFFSTGNGVSQNATLEVQNDGATTNTGEFRFSTRNQAGTLAERMRLGAEGKLCINRTSTLNGAWLAIQTESGQTAIGTTWADNTYLIQQRFSSQYFLGVGADAAGRTLSLAANSADATAKITFLTSGNGTLAERARIKSAGEIASASAGDYGIRTAVTAGAGTTTGIFVGARSATAGDTGSGTDTFIVWSNGNVVNTNNSYGALSDIKLKENIIDATPKLEKLSQVRVVNFNMIGETQKQLGVIAQELEQIFPGMVDESPDKDAEGNDLGTTTKSVKYSVFVPMLIKALQEQQAIIESLKARLDAANL